MMKQWYQKRGGHSFKLHGLLSIIILLFCSLSTTLHAGEIMCKGLKPFNNIDELLYQFYVNLDSDCLFNMSGSELEEIWGIKMLYIDMKNYPGNYPSSDPIYFYKKPYQSEKDTFFMTLIKGRDDNATTFDIRITEEYMNKHGSLFPDGNFPKLLPKPRITPFIREFGPPHLHQQQPKALEKPRDFGVYRMDSYKYYWLNSKRTHMISLIGEYGVTGVTVKNHVRPDHRNNFLR